MAAAGTVLAGACGGDDPESAPPKKTDAGRDSAPDRDAARDTGRDASPDSGPDSGPDVAPDTARCAESELDCGDRCADTRTDRAHCGRCSNPCFGNNECADGVCLAPCAVDQGRCLGRCVSLATDNANCGQCGRACEQGKVCSNGECSLECGPPLTTCIDGATPDAGTDAGSGTDAGDSGSADAGDAQTDAGASDTGSSDTSAGDAAPPARYCANLGIDEDNCGACGRACGVGERCTNGSCALVCPSGQTECVDGCHDLTTDRLNCGTCGKTCAAGQVCSASQCLTSCGAPFQLCNGACVNTSIDPANCGDCGKPCAENFHCIQGGCVPGCPAPGKICSDGRCHDVTSDNQHCGDCGKPCAAGSTCIAGRCELFCPPGETKCSPPNAAQYCANVSQDRQNCGTCGNACGSAELCLSPGVCACPPGKTGPGCTANLDCNQAPCLNGSCVSAGGTLRCECQETEPFPNDPYWDQTRRRAPFSIEHPSHIAALPQGFTVSAQFDHARLVASGRASADGNNVRVVYTLNGVHTEVDRMLHPASNWNRADTRLLFPLATPVGAGSKVTYWLYYGGAATAPPADATKIISRSAGWFVGASNINLVGPQLADCFLSGQIRQLGRTSFELFGYDRTSDAAGFVRLTLTDQNGAFNHNFGDFGTFPAPGTQATPLQNLTTSISVFMESREFSSSCQFFGSERVGYGSSVLGQTTRAYTRELHIPDPTVSLPCLERRPAVP
jgi:hypothetical protein